LDYKRHKILCRSIRVLADNKWQIITNACEVANRTGKQAAIAKLVGRKTEVEILIQGVRSKGLWDTGAQVSLVNDNWLHKYLENFEVRPVTELLEGMEIEGVGSNVIPYSGYVVLDVEMTDGRAVKVPFLVTSAKLRQPVIGTNVMEEMVSSYGDIQLSSALKQQDKVAVSAITAELLTEYHSLSTVKTVRNGRKCDQTIKAGQIGVLKCRIKNIEVDDTTPVLFQPIPGWNGDQTGVRIQESLVKLKKGINQRVEVNVVNTSLTALSPNQSN